MAWASPVQLEEGNIPALFDAPVETTYKERVGQAGSTYLGHRFLARVLALNLTVFSEERDPYSMARIDSEFRKALSYDRDAVLRVESDMSGMRWLNVRLQEAPSYRGDRDPHDSAIAQYTVTLIAYDPWWRSDTYSDKFVFDGLNWHGGGVTVSNPTDVPCWPKWVLTAPAKFQLPDVSFKDDADKKRQIVLPFQPVGREVVVDTDPLQEMIVANDDTLLWAEMGGQFFQNPIPPYTPDTFVPVSVDPLPNLPLVLPDGWREWIADRIKEWAVATGQEEVFRRTPEDVAAEIRRVITESPPPALRPLSDAILEVLNIDFIAKRIADAWGSVNNMAGATAQVRLERRWSRPWGLE